MVYNKKMAEKKFYSFKDLLNSGAGGEDQHEPADKEVEKFPVVNVVTDKIKDKTIIKDRKVGDYSSTLITKDNKKETEGYKKINLFKDKTKKEDPYTRSEEYRNYLKVPNKKENELITKTRIHTLDKLLELDDKRKGGIIESSPMPEKSEPKKVQPEKTKIQQEKNALSAEDLKLQKEIYDNADFWKKVLIRDAEESESEEKRKRSKRELASFRINPYGWMREAIINSENKLRGELVAITDGDKQRKEEIERRLSIKETERKNLDDAHKKGIPLKLERDFTKDAITLDNGKIFNTTESLYLINKITKHHSKSYEIVGVVARGDYELIILKSDTGEHIDVRLGTAKRIIEEVEDQKKNGGERKSRVEIEKEEKFAQIKAGSVVEVRIGSMKSKDITKYRILDINNERVSFEDLTARARGQLVVKKSMSLDKMKAFLFDKNAAFIVNEGRVSRTPAKPETERLAKEMPPMMKKILQLENELGFIINTPLIVERYLKLSKEEAEALYNEYRALKGPTPAKVEKDSKEKAETEPEKIETPIVQEPVQEENGPTSEQIARFENYLMKDREIEARIKELEEELKNPKVVPVKENKEETKVETPKVVAQEAPEKKEEKKIEIKNDLVEKLTLKDLEQEIKNNISNLLENENLKKKKPEIKEFHLKATPKGFVIDSVVKINKTGVFVYPTATINLKVPLENNSSGQLSIGNYSIEAGAATGTVKKQMEPALPQLIPGIKTYFENKYGKSIESMGIENGELVLKFKNS